MDLVLLKSDVSIDFKNENPTVQLSVYPNAGISTDNIEVRCEISPPSIISPLSLLKFDNIYLSVQTDSVKPSGILLMFDDSIDKCEINKENVRVDVCNASLIIIHINHFILNETLQKIDYSCKKGTTYAFSSYRIISKGIFYLLSYKIFFFYYLDNKFARYYDPIYSSSSSLIHTHFLLVFVVFLTQIRWS
jgi:hypothetical protein